MNLNLEFTDPIQWNQDDEYSINDVVFNGADAYTAIDYVPSGTLLSNTAYWKKTGKFIRTQNLENGAVTTEKIATNAVTTGKLAGKAVTTAKIDDGAVTAEKLSTDALDGSVIGSASGESVTAADASYLASLTVDGKAVQDGTPTPSNPVDVQVVDGKNLAPTPTFISSGNTLSRPIPINTAFAISFTPTATRSYILYLHQPDETYIGSFSISGTAGTRSVTNVTPKSVEVGIIKCYDDSGRADITELQVETGTATPYIPYGSIGLKVGSNITPIDLQGNVLASLPDGTKDVLTVDSVGHCVLEKHVGEITLNGTTGKSVTNSWLSGNYPLFGTTAIDTLALSTSTGGLSNMFAYTNPDAMWGGGATYAGYFSIAGGENSLRFRLLDSSITMIADANTWLASNTPTFNYPLATATTIDLGYIDMPAIPDGSAISITAQVTPTITASWWKNMASSIAEALKSLRDDLIARFDGGITTLASSIAPVENGIASANYATGSYLVMDNVLYRVASPIASGESIVPGTNVEATTVMEEILTLTDR